MYIPQVPEYDPENYTEIGYSELFDVNRMSSGYEKYYENKRAVEIGFDDVNKLYYVEIQEGFKMYAGTTGPDNMYMYKRIPEEYAWYGGLKASTSYSRDACPEHAEGLCKYTFKLRQKSRFILLSEPYNLYQLYYKIQDQETRDVLATAFIGLKKVDFSNFRGNLTRYRNTVHIAKKDGLVDKFTDPNASPNSVHEYLNDPDDIHIILRFSVAENDDMLIKAIHPLISQLGYQGYVAFNMYDHRENYNDWWITFHEEIMVINPKKVIERDFIDRYDFSNSNETIRKQMLGDRKDKSVELSNHSVWTLLYVEKLMNRYSLRWNLSSEEQKLIAFTSLVHEEDTDIHKLAIELDFSLTRDKVHLIECVRKHYRELEVYVQKIVDNIHDYISVETNEYTNKNQEAFYTQCAPDFLMRKKTKPIDDEICIIRKISNKPLDGEEYYDFDILKREQVVPLTYLVKDTPNCNYYVNDEVKQRCIDDASRSVKIIPGPEFGPLINKYLEKISPDCRNELAMKATLLVSMASVIGLVPYGTGHINQYRTDIGKKLDRYHMAFSTTFPQIKNRFLTDLDSKNIERSREMKKIGLLVSELIVDSMF